MWRITGASSLTGAPAATFIRAEVGPSATTRTSHALPAGGQYRLQRRAVLRDHVRRQLGDAVGEQRAGEVDPLPAAAAQFDPLHDRDIRLRRARVARETAPVGGPPARSGLSRDSPFPAQRESPSTPGVLVRPNTSWTGARPRRSSSAAAWRITACTLSCRRRRLRAEPRPVKYARDPPVNDRLVERFALRSPRRETRLERGCLIVPTSSREKYSPVAASGRRRDGHPDVAGARRERSRGGASATPGSLPGPERGARPFERATACSAESRRPSASSVANAIGAERPPRRRQRALVDRDQGLPRRRADAFVDRRRRPREPRGVGVLAVERGLRGEPGERLGDVELVADVAREREAVEEPAPRRPRRCRAPGPATRCRSAAPRAGGRRRAGGAARRASPSRCSERSRRPWTMS